jgi:NDP-4-keto-2,6-dideoxyhexose 3-C-methyltransferase
LAALVEFANKLEPKVTPLNSPAMYKTISQCRICGNAEFDTILDLGVQALTGVFPREPSIPIPAAPLELIKCRTREAREACGLVQLRHSFEASEMYGMNYGYRSGLNQSMVRHLQELAAKVKSIVNLVPGDVVLDIGSNDSTLLQAMDQAGLRLIGMDPTGVKFRQYYPPHIRLIADFFSPERFRAEASQDSARLVTSIAMFYDLESPLEFMRQVREVLANDGLWVFEQSYLPAMLARNSYDTVCHEHLEYYSLKQILWTAARAGLHVLDVELNDVNGGSFCVVASREDSPYPRNEAAISKLLRQERDSGLDGLAIYAEFRDRILRNRDQLRRFLRDSRKNGERTLGYGASTKGNVILQFCGITADDLAFIAEVNPDKFGSFTPGSLIPIISEGEARAMAPSAFLVLPWHFRDHIIHRENRFLAAGGKLIFPLPNLEVISEKGSDRRV